MKRKKNPKDENILSYISRASKIKDSTKPANKKWGCLKGKNFYALRNWAYDREKEKRKRKRNPKPSLEILNQKLGEYGPNLRAAILEGNPKWLSHALMFKNIGLFCYDCDENGTLYEMCTCEGDTEISGPCRYCKQNRCICDYPIWTNDKIDFEKVRKIAWRLLLELNIETIIYNIKLLYEKLIEGPKVREFILNRSLFLKKFYKYYSEHQSEDPSQIIHNLNNIL